MSTCVEFVATQFVSFIPLKYSSSSLRLLLSRSAASSCAINEPGGHTAPNRLMVDWTLPSSGHAKGAISMADTLF